MSKSNMTIEIHGSHILTNYLLYACGPFIRNKPQVNVIKSDDFLFIIKAFRKAFHFTNKKGTLRHMSLLRKPMVHQNIRDASFSENLKCDSFPLTFDVINLLISNVQFLPLYVTYLVKVSIRK